jgi:hypothetical protein
MTVCRTSASRPSRSSGADVEKGAFPEDKHLVPIANAEFEAFIGGL